MATTVQQLVTDIRTEGGFNVDDAQALRWLNRRWVELVSRAFALRRKVTIGNTVAGTAFYAFPASPVIVLAYSFEVAGVPYGKARRSDVYADSQGALWVSPDGAGLILADADANGAKGITLIPVPGDGSAITSFAAVAPADLTIDTAGNTLLAATLEEDFIEALIAGAVAIGLKRLAQRPDAAAPFEAEFQAGVAQLERRTKRRHKGQGPHQIRVIGVNA